MGALQQGLVIVLLSRGPSGERNVFPSSDLCILRGSPRWLSRQCGTKKCGTNQSATLPFSILPNPLADQYQIPLPCSARSFSTLLLSPTCISLSSVYDLSPVPTAVRPASRLTSAVICCPEIPDYLEVCVNNCAVQCHLQNAVLFFFYLGAMLQSLSA